MIASTPNILLLIVDALRMDALSCYGSHQDTPNCDRLAASGTLFSNTFSSTNATDSSVTTILTGMEPKEHGIINHGKIIQRNELESVAKVRGLPEILVDRGYYTFAVDWLGRWHSRGFHDYGTTSNPLKHQILQTPIRRLAGSQRIGATKLVDHALERIRTLEIGQPFFGMLHFWDCHLPYRLPRTQDHSRSTNSRESHGTPIEEMLEAIANPTWKAFLRKSSLGCSTTGDMIDWYHQEVSNVDAEIGRLVKELAHLQVLDNTLVILTSDHGESLTEHGIYFDHHGLYDVSTHVPFMLSNPMWVPAGKVVRQLVQHIDLLPTILDLLGIENTDELSGKSLLPLLTNTAPMLRPFIFAHEAHAQHRYSVRTHEYKFIFAPPQYSSDVCRYCGVRHGMQEELYDVVNDGKETHNLARQIPSLSEDFVKLIGDWRSARIRKRAQADLVDHTDDESEVERRLSDLGYL